jgi:hypothetical protein
MAREPEAPDTGLVGRLAHDELLAPAAPNLPAELGRAELMPPSRARPGIVAGGVVMTGVTLLGGLALIVVALVSAFSHGADLGNGALFALGLVLVATHWGWVHVAELTAGAVEVRSGREIEDRRRAWQRSIAPYAHYEVLTEVEEDGSIAIVRVAYRPVPASAERFTFVREIEHREVHSGEEPAAVVADRAERLRREAALDTDRERERYLAAADERETVRLLEADERERLDAQRAASRALSERINTHLREPPLEE